MLAGQQGAPARISELELSAECQSQRLPEIDMPQMVMRMSLHELDCKRPLVECYSCYMLAERKAAVQTRSRLSFVDAVATLAWPARCLLLEARYKGLGHGAIAVLATTILSP